MRRFLLLLFLGLVLAVAVPGALFAQSSKGFTSYYKPGNVALGVDVGGGFYYSAFSFVAYPSAEFLLAKYRIGDYLPLDLGAAVRGRVGLDSSAGGAGIDVGVGGFGTAHVGFRGISGDIGKILGRFDLFAGLGLAFDVIAPSNYAGLGFAWYSGLNYFIKDNFAVTLSGQGWHKYVDYTIGLRFKFGSSKEARKAM